MPTTHKLVLVKHSLPRIVEGAPARTWHLGDEGKARCARLAERLATFTPSTIFSSVEPKAIETATLVAQRLGARVQLVEGLHEHERERVGFLSKVEFEAAARRFFEQPDRLVFGDETANAARARFERAIEKIARTSPSVIVAHGTVISLFAASRLGREPFEMWKSLELPDVVELDYML